jgi:N utilization substance protein B
MAGLRREARIAALQVLFELDCSGHNAEEVLARALEDKDLPGQYADFCRGLVNGVIQKKKDIDDVIRRFAPLFPPEQLATIDRNILRLAIYEIQHSQVPMKAVVNEAIELSKGYASDSSPKFINGVLGSVIANSGRSLTEPEVMGSN